MKMTVEHIPHEIVAQILEAVAARVARKETTSVTFEWDGSDKLTIIERQLVPHSTESISFEFRQSS